MVKSILNLIRWKNLAISALTILVLKYCVFEVAIGRLFSMSHSTLDLRDTLLLCISVALIGGAGYIINDLNDIKADLINKPDKVIINKGVSEKLAHALYLIFNIVGIIIAVYIGDKQGDYQLALIHVFTTAILWIYSTYFKNSLLIGNFLVAIASAFIPLVYLVFEGLGYINLFKQSILEGPLQVLFYFSIILAGFAFLLTMIREIIKDLQDEKGDYAVGGKTAPIALGTTVTKAIVYLLAIVFAGSCAYLLHTQLDFNPFNTWFFYFYAYLLIIIPSIFLIYDLSKSRSNDDYQTASNLVKIIMLTGIITTVLYATNV